MIKRSPQEIADFFGCYVAQDEAGSWFLYQDKPALINESWSVPENSILLLNEELINVPVNHHWRCLYEPRMQKPERPDHASHQSEVFIHGEYNVVKDGTLPGLAAKVINRLNNGWKLQGGVAVEYLPESDGYKEGSETFYQAMVRGI